MMNSGINKAVSVIHPRIHHEQGCNLGAALMVVDGLELVLHDVGVSRHVGKGCFKDHQHSYGELLIGLSGEGRVRSGDEGRGVGAGDVVYLSRGVSHEMTWACPRLDTWRLLVLHFDIDLDPESIGAPGVHPFRMAFYSFYDWFIRQEQLSMKMSPCALERVQAMMAIEHGRMGAGPTAPVSCMGLLLSLLGLVVQELCAQGLATALPDSLSSGDGMTHRLHQAVRLIEERGGHLKVSIEEIAQAVGLSSSHFIRCFKEKYGQSPHRYALEITMRHAGALLQSEVPIKEIAYTLGYKSQSSFARAFQEFYKYNPSVYRQNSHKRPSS